MCCTHIVNDSKMKFVQTKSQEWYTFNIVTGIQFQIQTT